MGDHAGGQSDDEGLPPEADLSSSSAISRPSASHVTINQTYAPAHNTADDDDHQDIELASGSGPVGCNAPSSSGSGSGSSSLQHLFASPSADVPMIHDGSPPWPTIPPALSDSSSSHSSDLEMADAIAPPIILSDTPEQGLPHAFAGPAIAHAHTAPEHEHSMSPQSAHDGQAEPDGDASAHTGPAYVPLAPSSSAPSATLVVEPTTPTFPTPDHNVAHQPGQLPGQPPAMQQTPPQFLQQVQAPNFVEEIEDDWVGFQTVFSPNPMSLAPENLGFVDFLRQWAFSAARRPHGSPREIPRVPSIHQVLSQARDVSRTRVDFHHLRGEACDFQGVNWTEIGVPKRLARQQRCLTYKNYVNKHGSDMWRDRMLERKPYDSENYFKFRAMELKRDIRLLHFQLRNILGCASRTSVFYPSHGTVKELDPTTGRTRKAMVFDADGHVQVSTLSADQNLLVAGDFSGSYHFRSLETQGQTQAEGRLTDNVSGITNHVQVYQGRRSGGPLAAFASNDYGFRVVDLTTNTMVSEASYDYALNCSAISPDRRLRVVVGDSLKVTITDAETGEVLQDLPGHRDYGFACDWAADGWTVATGFQDKTVRIWDARMWKQPVHVIRSEMSGVRSLRFSPLGSGKRLLVAAEEADIVNIIDAQTFETKQQFDVFGELGGIAFTDQGQSLMTLVCDRVRGGVVQLDRCDAGAEDVHDYAELSPGQRRARRVPFWQSRAYDWKQAPEDALALSGSTESMVQRRRKAALMGNLDPY